MLRMHRHRRPPGVTSAVRPERAGGGARAKPNRERPAGAEVRTRRRSWALLAAAALASGARAVPQADHVPEPALLGFVQRADGSPLSDATVTAWPAARGHDVVGLRGLLPAPPPVEGTTDARGSFHLAAGEPAWLEVTGDGLGALCCWVQPGDPVRLVATPLGAVVLPPGALGAHVRTEAGDALGWRAGGEVRLPAGTFRLLVRFADGLDEHRVLLGPSARVALFRSTRAPFAVRFEPRLASQAIVDGWSGVPLRPDAEGRVEVWAPAPPARAHRLTFAVAGPEGAVALHASVVGAGETEVSLLATRWRQLDGPLPDHGLVATLAGSPLAPRCVALTPLRGGTTMVPDAEDLQHVVLAAGTAITALPSVDQALELPAARDLTVSVVDTAGPVADAEVELRGVPPHVTRRAVTDRRGRVRFAAVPRARCTLLLDAAEVVAGPTDVSLAQLDEGRVSVQATPGAALAGRVTLGGAPPPASQVIDLTLRDPTGVLATTTRRAAVRSDGSFRFGGLPPGGRFTLFATTQVDGITYSAKLHGVLAGTEVALDLHVEDVPMPRPVRR